MKAQAHKSAWKHYFISVGIDYIMEASKKVNMQIVY